MMAGAGGGTTTGAGGGDEGPKVTKGADEIQGGCSVAGGAILLPLLGLWLVRRRRSQG